MIVMNDFCDIMNYFYDCSLTFHVI